MTASRPGTEPADASVRKALTLILGRLTLVAGFTLLAWLCARATTGATSFQAAPLLGTLALFPANLLSLWWARRLLRSEGERLRDQFRPRTSRLHDVGWGLLWLVVLYVPFVVTIMGVMWLLYGSELFSAFETLFVPEGLMPTVTPGAAVTLGLLTVVTFAPVNAPAEELVYRGYGQSRLTRAWPSPLAILTCSLVFGLQHVFFAPTRAAMIVYAAAFTVWGVGSALIVRRQGRLLPITVSHFLVNFLLSLPAVAVPAMQLTGRLPS